MAHSPHVSPGVSSVGPGVTLLEESWVGDGALGKGVQVVETPWTSKVSRQTSFVTWSNFLSVKIEGFGSPVLQHCGKLDVFTAVKTHVLTDAERSRAKPTRLIWMRCSQRGGRFFCVRRSRGFLWIEFQSQSGQSWRCPSTNNEICKAGELAGAARARLVMAFGDSTQRGELLPFSPYDLALSRRESFSNPDIEICLSWLARCLAALSPLQLAAFDIAKKKKRFFILSAQPWLQWFAYCFAQLIFVSAIWLCCDVTFWAWFQTPDLLLSKNVKLQHNQIVLTKIDCAKQYANHCSPWRC